MKPVWKSDDGKIFDSKIDCLEYEKINALKIFVEQNIKTDIEPDSNYSGIEIHNVVELIETYFDEFVKIMNGKTVSAKVCKNKVDGVCQNHNLQCDYPTCEK